MIANWAMLVADTILGLTDQPVLIERSIEDPSSNNNPNTEHNKRLLRNRIFPFTFLESIPVDYQESNFTSQ